MILSELYLGSCLSSLGIFRKDVEDQHAAVDDFDLLELFFNVAYLGRAEFIIKNHHIGLMKTYQLHEVLQLALANKSARIRIIKILC